MKMKIVWVLCLLALLCLPVKAALADNGPHGGYTPTTDACAACHRAHTASAEALLISPMPGLCFTCHGSTGSGADTNVVDGIYGTWGSSVDRDGTTEVPAEGSHINANRSLKGGGFVNALMDTNWDGSASVISTTSDHLNAGQTITNGTVWGYGPITTSAYAGLTDFNLSCTSCHDPHGGAGSGGAPTYRLLRLLPTGLDFYSTTTTVAVAEELAHFYTLTDNCYKTNNQYFGEGYASFYTGPAPAPEGCYNFVSVDLPESQLTAWCKQCHTRYVATTNSGHTNSTDPIFTYRHMSTGLTTNCGRCHNLLSFPDLLPGIKNGDGWQHYVECMTCHVAHGSSAQMGVFAGAVEWPDGATSPGGNARSSLLRTDGRGVCELCHGKRKSP